MGKSKSAAARNARQERRDKAEALRRRAEAERRRRSIVFGSVVGVIAVVLVGLLVVAVTGQDKPDASGPSSASDLAAVSGLGAESSPPWPAPADVSTRVEAAGMDLGPMGTAEHYHAHLDVIVDGETVPVPANLGVDTASGAMAALHTHEGDGIIHIEADTEGEPFTLGQLFTEWNVKLGPERLGALGAGGGEELAVYVNGDKVDGDPRLLRLEPHQQISVVFGSPDETVAIPDSYEFGDL